MSDLGLQMLGYPHNIVHDPFGSREDKVIDALEYVVRAVRKNHEESIVDVSASERTDAPDLAGGIEMLGDLVIYFHNCSGYWPAAMRWRTSATTLGLSSG